jgi:glycosyltransferase involved in cell wall biosynthesis
VDARGEPTSRPLHPFASIVVTVRNEARHIADLLDSLVVQEPPFEVVIVDAESTDGTADIIRSYAARFPNIRLVERATRRGGGRNLGVQEASGEVVAFIDGDCIANPFWLQQLRRALATADVAAGRTIQIGYWAFESLNRVELEHQGYDVTFPSCNLAYWKQTFEKAGGFDDSFHTAEDIDLNYRAVDIGATLRYNGDAIVYHRARDTITKFLKQAYWNGYGRKQLTLKHGNLWSQYSFGRMVRSQASFWGLLRLGTASLGYLVAKIKEPRRSAA